MAGRAGPCASVAAPVSNTVKIKANGIAVQSRSTMYHLLIGAVFRYGKTCCSLVRYASTGWRRKSTRGMCLKPFIKFAFIPEFGDVGEFPTFDKTQRSGRWESNVRFHGENS